MLVELCGLLTVSLRDLYCIALIKSEQRLVENDTEQLKCYQDLFSAYVNSSSVIVSLRILDDVDLRIWLHFPAFSIGDHVQRSSSVISFILSVFSCTDTV